VEIIVSQTVIEPLSRCSINVARMLICGAVAREQGHRLLLYFTPQFVPVDRLCLGSKQFQLRTLRSIPAGLHRLLLRMNADLVAQRRAAGLSKSAARRS